MNSAFARFLLVAACCLLSGGVASQDRVPIDQVPMYGGMDRNADPTIRRADQEFIENAMATLGSRERASNAWVNRGFDLYLKDDLAGAMRRFNQAWLLNPDNPEVYWGFSAVLNDRREFCEALRMVELASTKGPIQPGFLPDAGVIYSACAMESKSLDAEARRRYLARSDELFVQALASPEVKRDYALAQWAVAKYFGGDYAGAWEKVAQYRRETGKAFDPAMIRELSAKLPEPK